jgi:type IV pilus assembly protein PilO
MASKSRHMNFDVTNVLDHAASQFRGLNPQEPGQWPALPKAAAWMGAVLIVIVLGWFALLSGAADELQVERDREPALKADYRAKQKLQVQEYVTQLEKQLPGKAEMDALLSDINQAGLGRGLQFELFRPGQVEVKEYYAELPITIRVSGRYHDIGSFTADVANLSRIVTLHNLNIAGVARDTSGTLAMDAVARTYRYLDTSEVDAQRKAQSAKSAGAKK